jgi:hypothetical protein
MGPRRAESNHSRGKDAALQADQAALADEDAVITKGDKLVVRLVAIPQRQFKSGVLKRDALGPGPDFFPHG